LPMSFLCRKMASPQSSKNPLRRASLSPVKYNIT
jgi:hypothetical protein